MNKYIIGIEYKNGTRDYIASSRTNSRTEELAEAAQFVQRKSAEKVIRDLRRDAMDVFWKGKFFVAELTYAITDVTTYDQLGDLNEGFVLLQIGKYSQYYYAGAKNSTYFQNYYTNSIHRATLFKSEQEALSFVQDSKQYLENQAENEIEENEKIEDGYGYFGRQKSDYYQKLLSEFKPKIVDLSVVQMPQYLTEKKS